MPWMTEPADKEEQRLEEGMRHQVEHAGDVSAHAHRRDHKTQLADGGIGQHFLDIELADGDGGGEQSGQRRRPARPRSAPAAPARTAACERATR